MLEQKNLIEKSWWPYLEEDLQELLKESLVLLSKVKSWEQKFHDYSFVVFPAAKAYEGFLKKAFLDMGFISEEDYSGKRFRIGKALNPSLDLEHRNSSWVYDNLTNFCKGKELPDELWNTWKNSRNLVFHWFPNEINAISLIEAEERIEMVVSAIDELFTKCSVKLKR